MTDISTQVDDVSTERCCESCGKPLEDRRSSARFCPGGACQKRAKRAELKQKELEAAGLIQVGERTYPYQIGEGVRLNWCAAHSEEYLEYWHGDPFRIWNGSCETCSAEQAVIPKVDALIEQRRFDIDRQVSEHMEAIATEQPEYFEKTFIQEPIPAELAMGVFSDSLRACRVANAQGDHVIILGVLKETGFDAMREMHRLAIRTEIVTEMREKATAELIAAYKQAKRQPRPVAEPVVMPEPKFFTNPAASASYWASEVAKSDPAYPDVVKGGL